jgi:hypothetical protein
MLCAKRFGKWPIGMLHRHDGSTRIGMVATWLGCIQWRSHGMMVFNMRLASDHRRDANLRGVVVGLAAVAATVSAEFAAFVDHLGWTRVMEFLLSGLCAAALILLTSAGLLKKNGHESRLCLGTAGDRSHRRDLAKALTVT